MILELLHDYASAVLSFGRLEVPWTSPLLGAAIAGAALILVPRGADRATGVARLRRGLAAGCLVVSVSSVGLLTLASVECCGPWIEESLLETVCIFGMAMLLWEGAGTLLAGRPSQRVLWSSCLACLATMGWLAHEWRWHEDYTWMMRWLLSLGGGLCAVGGAFPLVAPKKLEAPAERARVPYRDVPAETPPTRATAALSRGYWLGAGVLVLGVVTAWVWMASYASLARW